MTTNMNYYLGVKSLQVAAQALNSLSFVKILDVSTMRAQITNMNRIEVIVGPAKGEDMSSGVIVCITGSFTDSEMVEIDKLAKFADKSVIPMVAVTVAQTMVALRQQGISGTHKILELPLAADVNQQTSQNVPPMTKKEAYRKTDKLTTNKKPITQETPDVDQDIQQYIQETRKIDQPIPSTNQNLEIIQKINHASYTNAPSLDLSGNNLTTLPPEIGLLTKLYQLNLSNNNLTSLPTEIGKLTSLTQLMVYKNQLTALPPEIGNLTNLNILYISDNKLTTLPPEVSKLTKLTILDIRGNDITTPPQMPNCRILVGK